MTNFQPTHFIEQWGPKLDDLDFEFSAYNYIEYLPIYLAKTGSTEFIKTIAVFKIQFKPGVIKKYPWLG